MARYTLKYEVIKGKEMKTREVIKKIILERLSLMEEKWCGEDENSSLLQGIDGK